MPRSLDDDIRFWNEVISDGERIVRTRICPSEVGSALYALLNKDFRTLREKHPHADKVTKLVRRAENLFYEFVRAITKDSRYRKENIGEPSHDVFVLPGIEGFVIKTSNDRQELLDEQETTKIYRQLVSGRRDAGVAEPILVSERDIDGKYLFVTKRESGKTVYRMMDKDPALVETLMPHIIDFMAFLHMKYDSPTKGDLNLFRKMESCLFNPHLGFRPSLARALLFDMYPLLASLTDSRYVHNTDFHPENILVTKDWRYIKLDCTRNYLVPCELELANFFIYKDFFKDEMMPDRVKLYAQKIGENPKEVMLRFYNAIIPRAFMLMSAWSNPRRPLMRRNRKDLALTAASSIFLLNENEPDFFYANKKRIIRLGRNISAVYRML